MATERRFLAVKHEWFNSSYGFKVREIYAESFSEACDKGDIWEARANRSNGMNHARVKVVDPDSDYLNIENEI